jgi:hypothetical protein
MRGGSAHFLARFLRAAYRMEAIVSWQDDLLGFRVARSLPGSR